MITIGEDKVTIENYRQRAQISFAALGGPEDPILASVIDRDGDKVLAVEMAREDIEQFQVAFVNFMNTGYFDQEG